MKTIIGILITWCIITLTTPAAAEPKEIKYGIGTDVTNLLMSGYSLRVAGVFKQMEIEMAIGGVTWPDWMLPGNIDGGAMQEISLLIKYNLGKNVTKPFFGAGCLYSDSDFDYSTSQEKVTFRNTYIFGSVGCYIRIGRHFRLIPSVQAGVIVAGQTEKTVAGWTYTVENYAFGGAIGFYYYF